ncbi:hypothetical protein OUZ56_005213 [Daphnia magna]|uniref:BOD1/SHG1 domain-containing protein n=1 Tax=Daphnia magna TaxID=35525 RepID=A0ABQ9YS66_9CRUS|nr:hypothetical protein OUZ56_005213 [Daphnia magna]
MEIPPPFHQLPADPKFVGQIVNQIKSQGTFDQWRRECLADVDTKPAYQNLTFRVDSAVAAFLGKQRWRPDMAKNQMRENLRKHILELGLIDKGVDRIVQQVVQPKVLPIFHPAVESAIYNFLGIKNPRAGISNQLLVDTSSTTTSPRKAFRPMPVSVPNRDKEDCTPPPGEEFDLEAITPSPEPRCGSSLKKDHVEGMSDVSMEDSRPAAEVGLERICSPISPQSSRESVKTENVESTAPNRVGSALSAISSGDDLPSESPAAGSPVTSDEFHDNNNPTEHQPRGSPESSIENDDDMEEDDEDDFSSPEFEKLEITAPTSRTVTPVPGEEEPEDKCEDDAPVDDHFAWRPKTSSRDPDRKRDEDPDNLGSKKAGDSTNGSASRDQTSESGSQLTGEMVKSDSGKPTARKASTLTAESLDAEEIVGDKTIEPSVSSSTKERSRSRLESHKSDRRDKSHKDKDRNKDRDRDRQRDRDREKRREREKKEEADRRSKSHHSKSEHRDRDSRRKSSSRRDKDHDRHKDRERDRNRSRSSHEVDRYRSSSQKDKGKKPSSQAVEKSQKEPSISPLPTLHPKAYLWKRPTEKPKALWDYLARFPEEFFDESNDSRAGLSDVSVSSVSSYEDSDSESTILLYLSEIEIDSDVEEAVVHSGGRVIYRYAPDTEEAKGNVELNGLSATDEFPRSESYLRDQQLNINNNKRVRKLNTRYNDSYVGSELRKIITTQNSIDHSQSSPQFNNNSKSQPRENQENCIQVSSPEEIPGTEDVIQYQPPDAKRLKTDQPPPSSPESVQSDLTHPSHAQPSTPPVADLQLVAEEDTCKDNTSPNGRRRSTTLKQPQQRYDDADLYKPRPVITPSSRRSRRLDDS